MIYFIQDLGNKNIKIGYTSSNNANERLKGCQTGNPNPLRVLGTIEGTQKDEAELHRRFQDHHKRGEWFDISESKAIEFILERNGHALGYGDTEADKETERELGIRTKQEYPFFKDFPKWHFIFLQPKEVKDEIHKHFELFHEKMKELAFEVDVESIVLREVFNRTENYNDPEKAVKFKYCSFAPNVNLTLNMPEPSGMQLHHDSVFMKLCTAAIDDAAELEVENKNLKKQIEEYEVAGEKAIQEIITKYMKKLDMTSSL